MTALSPPAIADFGIEPELARALGRLGWTLTPADQHQPVRAAMVPVERIANAADLAVPVFATGRQVSFDQRLAALRAGVAGVIPLPASDGEIIAILDPVLHPRPETADRRILLVDDDPSVLLLYGNWLERAGYHVFHATCGAEALDALERFAPEALVVDLTLPDCSGDELARLVRQQPHFAALPILYLSAERRPVRQGMALSQGGDSFIVKPATADTLLGHVGAALTRQTQLSGLLSRDPMTGLLNPVAFRRDLQQSIALAQRARTPLSLALIDVDHFKAINDQCGHPVGDRVLRRLARHLVAGLRHVDLVGRLGGEEFAVLLSNTPGEAAIRVIDGLRASFASLPPETRLPDEPAQVTFSAGVVRWDGVEVGEHLLARADIHLYAAKAAGRNQVKG